MRKSPGCAETFRGQVFKGSKGALGSFNVNLCVSFK